MKKHIFLLLLLIPIGLILSEDLGAFGLFRSAKVTLLVVDDNGQPVSGAKVGVGFEGSSGRYKGKNGFTGDDGLFTASGDCLGEIQYGAEKNGYYPSHYNYSFKSMGFFRLEPWNPKMEVLLRKIENPVPMYVRNSMNPRSLIKIPVIGKDVGFDLIMYDFVQPYGLGKYSDMIFRLEKSYASMDNYSAILKIKFSNNADGIQKIKENEADGSSFKLPRFAPESGYSKTLEVFRKKIPGGISTKSYESYDNYIFRIRSEINDKEFIKTMYGKIRGPIQIDPRREPTEVYFTYYLNPDYTRNLEFDPKRNLFGNLPDLERVTEP